MNVMGHGCSAIQSPEERLAAALDRASPQEREAWELGERTVLRSRLDATGLALPRV